MTKLLDLAPPASPAPTPTAALEPRATLAAYNQLRTNLTEAAQHSRNLFMTHLAVQGYALIVLAGLTDRMFFEPRARQKLPVLDASVPLGWFVPALSLLSLLVFVYWQMYQRKMWRLANHVREVASAHSKDPAFVPPDGDFSYPWIAFFVTDDDHVLKFGAVAFGVFQWALTPLVQLVCALRTVRLGGTLESWVSSGIPSGRAFVVLFATTMVANVWLWLAQRSLRSTPPGARTWRRSLFVGVRLGLVLTGLVGLICKIFQANEEHGAQLRYVRAPSAYLVLASLHNADLSGASLGKVRLEDADLSYASLDRANLSDADLQRANLKAARLEGANLTHANLYGAKLTGAKLDHAKLDRAILQDTDLLDAWLWDADLRTTDLIKANLSGAVLCRANLTEANLMHADFSSARLEGANLTHANLFGANLAAASLTGAVFGRADLTGADLTGAIGLTQAQLDTAYGDDKTKLPADLTIPRKPEL